MTLIKWCFNVAGVALGTYDGFSGCVDKSGDTLLGGDGLDCEVAPWRNANADIIELTCPSGCKKGASTTAGATGQCEEDTKPTFDGTTSCGNSGDCSIAART